MVKSMHHGICMIQEHKISFFWGSITGFPAEFSFSAKNLRRQNDTSALQPPPVIFGLLHLHTRPDSSKTLALYKSFTYLLTYLLTMQSHNEGFNTPGCKELLSTADFFNTLDALHDAKPTILKHSWQQHD